MRKPSSISRLPKEIREKIGALRQEGCTIDEILAALEGMKVSRSALGRHLQKQNQIAERLHIARSISETLAEKLGDATPGRAQTLNIELMQTAILKCFLDADNPEGKIGETKDIHMLSSSLANLSKATQNDLAFRQSVEKQIREKLQAETKVALAKAQKKSGISKETADTIAREILGIRA